MEVKNIIEKIKQNDVQYLREFFQKYPSEVNQEDIYGLRPLHWACVWGRTIIVELLVQSPGVKINVVDKEDCWTPLHCAVEWEHYDVVTLMLSQDSVELDLKDWRKRTPLLLAISNGNLGIIHELVTHGANINAVDVDGNNCLHLALNNDRWHSEAKPIYILNEYCTKLELGEDCRCTQPVVFCYLVHHGADLYCKNKNNVTALDLIKKADVRKKIETLFPPLHCMFCGKDKSMVKFHACGHSLTCKECYLKNPLRKCLCYQQLVRNKSGFETPKIEKKVPKVPQPTPGTSSVSQPIVVPKLSDKAVQTMVEPVESPKSYEQFLQDVAQQVKWQQIESSKSYEQFLQDLAQQLTVVPKLSDKEVQTMAEPVESPKLEQKHLHYVAKKLGNKWQQIGRELEIQQVDMDVINYDYPNDAVEQSFRMLYKWFTSCDPEKRCIENLREVLKANDCLSALECLSSDVK